MRPLSPDPLTKTARSIARQLPKYGHWGASIEAPDYSTLAGLFGVRESKIEAALGELDREEYLLLARTPWGHLSLTILDAPALEAA